MNRSLLQLVLRHADGLTADADGDAVLLRRFIATRDDAAFATLVKRHGPMVWAVCRQSVPHHSDAEDAFQATFLALAQSAKKVRTPDRLAGWLHAAAVRISAKAKRSFTRRAKHERATARPESDSPVSAASWSELQAAVHAEVADLPPSLRTVFVLCDLEGVDHAAAAKRLGLKPGTLSGQLARARQRLLAALAKRGIAAGAVTLAGGAVVPEVLANKVAGGLVPSAAVAELATEVTSMVVSELKLLAAGLLVAGGLTLGGVGWLATADGQELKTAPNPKPGGPPATGPGRPGLGGPTPNSFPGTPGDPGLGGPGDPPEWVPRGFEGAGPGGEGMPGMSGPAPVPAPGEFLFAGKPNTVAEVAKTLKDKSSKGWEYTGSLEVDPADPPKGKEFEGITKDTRVVLVFKKKPGPVGWGPGVMGGGGMGGGMPGVGVPGGGGGARFGGGAGNRDRVPPEERGGASNPLGRLIGGETPPPPAEQETVTVFRLRNAAAAEMAETLGKVFGPKLRVVPEASINALIVMASNKAAVDEVRALITLLDEANEKRPLPPMKK